MARVLVTCVGSGVGQSVLDSLNELRQDYIIGCDMNRNVYATHFCDEFHFVPGLYSEGYLDTLLNIAIERKADIIIPGHDHELALLSKDIDKFHAHGIEVLVSEPKVISISRDKYLWYEYFHERGCSIVPTYKVKDFRESPDLSIFPAIIKPAGGSASQGIYIVHKVEELAGMSDEDIIQPYLFPTKDDKNYETIVRAVNNRKFVQMSEISIQLIFGKDAKFKSIFISKNVLKNGIPVHIDTILPEEFEYLDEIMKFVPICEEQGVKGPVNVQGRITEKGIFFFEMNMRFTGITGNRAQLGFNEVKFLVSDFLGESPRTLNYTRNKVGVRQVACSTIDRTETAQPSSQTITILGGGGFLGTAFVRSIVGLSQYNRIVLVCRDSSYDKYVSKFQSPKIEVVKATNPFIQSVYNTSDILVNFAGALANHSEEEVYSAISFLYDQTRMIAQAGIPLVINASSQSLYDQTLNKKKTEEDDIRINSPYAFQKHITEKFFHFVRDSYPLSRVISLRFPRLLGCTEESQNGFFQLIPHSLRNGKQVVIDNPLNNTTLLHISDAVSAIIFVITQERCDLPSIMNVPGIDVSMGDYAAECAKILKASPDWIECQNVAQIERSSQIDGSKMKSLGWTPQKTLSDIIVNLLETK
nr:NAD-dependent epimerase/dehydratase family protein [uncultured Porphyromonas sp.]